LADAEFPSSNSTWETTTEDVSKNNRVDADAGTSDVLPLIACTSETRLYSLDQQAPFKLSYGSDDREDCLT